MIDQVTHATGIAMKPQLSVSGQWRARHRTAPIAALLLLTLLPLGYLQWQQREQEPLMTMLVGGLAGMLMVLAALLVQAYHRIDQTETMWSDSPATPDARTASDEGDCKSRFLIGMTQEIRTPFQGVLGMLNLLDETRLDSQQRDYLQTARDSAQNLLDMLNDILDVTSLASGTIQLDAEPTRLRAVMQDIESMLRASAREKGLTLEAGVGSDVPEWVMADSARVRQILFILLGQALKSTNEGSITARLSRPDDGSASVCLTVQDTGMGMDAATVAQLFNRLCQEDASSSSTAGVNRMGLEIARNLVTLMGGTLQVSSEPGLGSLFTVHMNLPETPAPATSIQQNTTEAVTRQLRVLVAEDDLINLKYLSILLDRMGHEAVFCDNGQEALQLMAIQRFDVVLLDYHMPLLDGLATTRAIRELQGLNKDVQIVLVTADVLNDTRHKALEAGVSDFVSKPLQAHDLQRALKRCGLLDTTATKFADTSPMQESSLIKLEDMATSAAGLIDSESYTELAASMPPDTLDDLLEQLFDPPAGYVHALMASLTARDGERIARDASRLKANATQLGFRALMRTSQQVESLPHDASALALEELAIQLLTDAINTERALREFRIALPASLAKAV